MRGASCAATISLSPGAAPTWALPRGSRTRGPRARSMGVWVETSKGAWEQKRLNRIIRRTPDGI
eukprot:3595967-Alexandrium_andersonii.AAC.1